MTQLCIAFVFCFCFFLVSKRNNLILMDCTERRIIQSTDYNDNPQQQIETQIVSRSLPQAMIPGHLLERIEMARSEYHEPS
jgi:hypothetical protein